MNLKNELKVSKDGLHAYCFSFRCLGTKTMSKGIKKEVYFHIDLCPDCRSLLVWKKMKRQHYVRKKDKQDF